MRLLPLLLRELRGARGRLAFFAACLSVGVAAVVAVAGIGAGLESGLRREARRLLAADLAVEGRAPLPDALDRELARFAGEVPEGSVARADLRELVTVVAAPPRAAPAPGGEARPGPSRLVELKVVDGPYPFYGELVLEPDRPLGELLDEGAVAAPELLAHLGLEVGDRLRVGGVDVPVAGVVTAEPDRLGGAFGFAAGPRLFLGPRTFERAGLEQTGSRIEYRALIRLPEGTGLQSAERLAERLRDVLPRGQRLDVDTWAEAQPSLRRGIERSERFLGLVALVSLLVGGIGVGQTVRAWLAGRMDAIAVLECLGARPREILLLYGSQTALLGLAGSLAGAAAGIAVVAAAPHLAGDLLPAVDLEPWQPAAVARGLGLGLAVAVLFGLPALTGALRVPPARVLRHSVEPLPPPPRVTWSVAAVLVAGIWGTATVQSGSPVLGTWFTLGALGSTLALAAAAWAVSRGAARLREEPPGARARGPAAGRFWLRHGVAALGRPGAGTLAAVVALGLGVLVIVGLWLVERRLTSELEGNLPDEAPSAFLVDIQPDQWPPLRRLLEEQDAGRIDSVPVIMARLSALDGVPVSDLVRDRESAGEDAPESDGREREEDGPDRWALSREQRLTYMEELPEDNRVVAGSLWADPDRAEVSVEEEFARDLGVDVGSTLTFDVQGVPVELTVTSLRTVDWGTFGINFFLVVEPGVLDEAPQFRIATVTLPEGTEDRTQDLVTARFPNVTMIQIREILEKIVAVIRAIAGGVRFVGTFTVLAGMAILGGAVSAGAARRRREVALLKTLGTTRAGVTAIYSVEYALLGLVAGAIGSAGAVILSWAVLTRGMDIEWAFDPLPLAAGVVGGAALAVVAGLAASVRALQSRPMDVLRL
ncbi:MAG: ABC transporter permease [Thermoanaerobaculia bacterium]